jgi:acyl carrier protein
MRSGAMRSRVIEVIANHLLVEKDLLEADPDADLKAKFDMDSLDLVELVLEIEEEFGVHISDGDVDGLKTVNDFVRHVGERG